MKGDTAFLVPLKGLLIRDPMSYEPLPAKGMLKPMRGKEGRYWRRRIRDGSVSVGKPAKSAKRVSAERAK